MLKTPTIRFFGLLAPAEAWRAQGFSHPFGDDFRGFIDFLPESYSRAFLQEAIASVPDAMANAGLFAGTPSDVAEQLRPYVAAGMRHVVPQAMSAALSQKHALYSMRALRTIRIELNR
jgi:phthiodiolone/phenolphthiodiolone dimycocerosates ketoreductase